MRVAIALITVGLSMSSAPASAYEKFIPLGNSYAPGQSTLPPLNSSTDQLNAKVDIIESGIYQRELADKKFQSDLNHFMDDRTARPGSNFIDY